MGESDSGQAERLARYQRMRDFTRTAEPSGEHPVAAGNRFVVQRHRARRRHYDLRLEIDGVLVSWAVPKGPTLDPSARHLAVHVEDHPLEYADFEGVIPAKEYGGGDVIVWDRGTWELVEAEDANAAIAAGNLHFDLFGEKLIGRFVLIRPDRAGAPSKSDKEQWLLLHKKDEHATPGWDPEEHPKSVKSGRTNEEVAANPDALWRSDLPAAEAEIPVDGKPKRAQPKRGKPVETPWLPPSAEELAELDALGGDGRWRVDGHELKLTNLDKVLFPADGERPAVTKRDLVRYHALIAPVALPYLMDRPLNTHRFPNGVDRPGFWHKAVPEQAPGWMRRWHNADAKPGRTQHYLIPDGVATMAWLANYGAVELHPWTSTVPEVDTPSWALFDIDPGEHSSFEDVLTLARLHRTALEHLGVIGRPKVTGQRGIQVWVPIAPRYTYAETREWVHDVSKAIGATLPELVSWAWNKNQRKGLARLDYTQNVSHKTLVAPYSARPAPGAPVSVPIEWDELDDPELRPDGWTIHTVLDRVTSVGDPFRALLGIQQELPRL